MPWPQQKIGGDRASGDMAEACALRLWGESLGAREGRSQSSGMARGTWLDCASVLQWHYTFAKTMYSIYRQLLRGAAICAPLQPSNPIVSVRHVFSASAYYTTLEGRLRLSQSLRAGHLLALLAPIRASAIMFQSLSR